MTHHTPVLMSMLAAAVPALSLAQGGAVPAPIRNDLAVRSAEIRWPQGHVPEQAQLFAHNEVVIQAPCARVWSHLVAASQWPAWYPNSKDVRLASGAQLLAADSHFSWVTFGLPIQSSVYEFEAERRLGWFGHGPGIHAYHAWLLSPLPTGCRVVTEEVANGPAAAQWRAQDPGAMHKGHDGWLQDLKRVSET